MALLVALLAALLAGTAPDAEGGLNIDLLDRALFKIGLQSALEDLLTNRLPLVPGALSTIDVGPAVNAGAAVTNATGVLSEAAIVSALLASVSAAPTSPMRM